MDLQIEEINFKIDQLRTELERFDLSVINQEVLEASQRLDTVLNKYYDLIYKRPGNK